MKARKAAKQIKRLYEDPNYVVRNERKCESTLISRTRSHYKRQARLYDRRGRETNDMSCQNLANYYWHQSARYLPYLWQDIEELWSLDKIQRQHGDDPLPEFIE